MSMRLNNAQAMVDSNRRRWIGDPWDEGLESGSFCAKRFNRISRHRARMALHRWAPDPVEPYCKRAELHRWKGGK